MDNTKLQISNFINVTDDGEGVLGKILYYSLPSVLIEKDVLAQICDDISFPRPNSKRLALADAFRSATGDIYNSKTVKGGNGLEIYKVYCRDNKKEKGMMSRELIKETLDFTTNDYKKLANITFSKEAGTMSYDDLVYDEHYDALEYCREAVRLFELYQVCVGRNQIETLLESFIKSLCSVKLTAYGKMYFIPREYMHKLDIFEDFLAQIEVNNQNKNTAFQQMECNSMFVVDDAKQREKMAAAFYRSIRKEIAEYEERANYLIQSGSQSASVMTRWVTKIESLEQMKREYENILKRELNDVDEDFTTLGFLSQELQIRARGIKLSKGKAA